MLRDEEFDASEMSLSNYMIALGKSDDRFVAIPVFPSRVFRHAYIWINAKAGITRPEDLRETKSRHRRLLDDSALLFVRGLLQHQYGVAPCEDDSLVSASFRACRNRDSAGHPHRQYRQG